MRKKMDYLEMVQFSIIFLGGSLAIAILLREAHVWWLNREERKSLAEAKKSEDEYYEGLKQSLLSFQEVKQHD